MPRPVFASSYSSIAPAGTYVRNPSHQSRRATTFDHLSLAGLGHWELSAFGHFVVGILTEVQVSCASSQVLGIWTIQKV